MRLRERARARGPRIPHESHRAQARARGGGRARHLGMTVSAPSEPGDLLADVAHLCALAVRESKPAVCGTYARATIVLAFAAIEAVTNDALAAMQTLVKGAAPEGQAGKPPWCHFEGRSHKY